MSPATSCSSVSKNDARAVGRDSPERDEERRRCPPAGRWRPGSSCRPSARRRRSARPCRRPAAARRSRRTRGCRHARSRGRSRRARRSRPASPVEISVVAPPARSYTSNAAVRVGRGQLLVGLEEGPRAVGRTPRRRRRRTRRCPRWARSRAAWSCRPGARRGRSWRRCPRPRAARPCRRTTRLPSADVASKNTSATPLPPVGPTEMCSFAEWFAPAPAASAASAASAATDTASSRTLRVTSAPLPSRARLAAPLARGLAPINTSGNSMSRTRIAVQDLGSSGRQFLNPNSGKVGPESSSEADEQPMADWKFITNHAQVLLCVAHDPEIRLREIAEACGITERAAHRIIADLEEAGYISRERIGRRNRYEFHPEVAMRHPRIGHALAARHPHGGPGRAADGPAAPTGPAQTRRRARRGRQVETSVLLRLRGARRSSVAPLALEAPHLPDLEALRVDDVLRHAPQLGVDARLQLGPRHPDRALVVGDHHLQEGAVEVRRVTKRGRVVVHPLLGPRSDPRSPSSTPASCSTSRTVRSVASSALWNWTIPSARLSSRRCSARERARSAASTAASW